MPPIQHPRKISPQTIVARFYVAIILFALLIAVFVLPWVVR